MRNFVGLILNSQFSNRKSGKCSDSLIKMSEVVESKNFGDLDP